jgi:hypothetical protein
VVKDTERQIVQHLEQEFSVLIQSLKDLVRSVPPENLVRSGAVVEQTCGGLTSNLWDDPFEWTLPETLSNPDRIVEYLSEVDVARQRAFSSIQDDRALTKYISDPSGERLLISLLLETLVRAAEFRGRALTVTTKTHE